MDRGIFSMSRLDPKFIALHCQEVGGKNYELSMQHVEYFVKLLMDSEELRLFNKVRIYLDEDYSSAETFTALGNFYFIHESIDDVLIWDFKEMCFMAVEGKEVFAGEIETVSTKEKSKFPQDFFPECKWSRKGFMRTRWNLNGTVFDLINIHLFHDASNFIAVEAYPSVYSKTRQRALEYTLDRFHNDEFGTAPFFLFGDFNFRTDTKAVIKKLCEGLQEVHNTGDKNRTVEYKDDENSIVFTLGKKEFRHNNHQAMFLDQLWLKEFDKEMDDFCTQLYEFPIHFPPSYPFIEDSTTVSDYMETRCPAWCDRVLLSQTARPLVHGDGESNLEYGVIGKSSCMGDHKPVFLKGGIENGVGRLSCCECHKPNSPVSFDLQSLPGENFDTNEKKTENSQRALTERFVIKRVNSASVVEVKIGLVRGNCSSGNWRSRSVSVSGGKPISRVRLISSDDFHSSSNRLQSHHSSSEEEWFQEENGIPDSLDPNVYNIKSDRNSIEEDIFKINDKSCQRKKTSKKCCLII
ncbi:type I inositol 1,4,5-trisphosphate 5-phosphatase isoform X2 [Cimex lectularius]|uniref:inositol-polyphosphate 5-phosphatase n=1 Tax=Cimex lectularius TaxID=79782 RepID=A0A8I6SJG6_CIMLE|nr:type I inositol 1,4,5-trisphosphate 5-phosphatase isoform X2 [Cimex lectularius]